VTPETIVSILIDCNNAVPQWIMVWNPRKQRFELYPAKENV
jgi:hypothetical protein